jgi:hypothetical protein
MKTIFRSFLIYLLKRSYEKDIKNLFDSELSKKLDCLAILKDG